MGQTRLRRCVLDDLVGGVLEREEVGCAVFRFDHHGEAAAIADPLDGRRQKNLGCRRVHSVQRASNLRRNGANAQIRGLALVPVLQDDIEHARIVERGVVVQRRDSRDADHAFHARRLLHQLDRLRHRRGGSLRRRGGGKIDADDKITLIFIRQEARRHARQTIEGEADEADAQQNGQDIARHQAPDESGVEVFRMPIDGIEGSVDNVSLLGRRRFPQPQGALGWLQRQGVHCRNERGGRYDESELLIHFAGQPREGRGGEKDRHQHERDADDRTQQLRHGFDRSVATRHACIDVTHHALDDDDGVIDNDADGQHQGEKGCRIDAETQHGHDREGADDRHRNRGRRHQHRAPVLQEQQNHDQHQSGRDDQGFVNLVDRGRDEFGAVEGDFVTQSGGEGLRQLFHLGVDIFGDGQRIGAGEQRNGDRRRRLAVKGRRLAV